MVLYQLGTRLDQIAAGFADALPLHTVVLNHCDCPPSRHLLLHTQFSNIRISTIPNELSHMTRSSIVLRCRIDQPISPSFFFFLNDTPPPEIYPLPPHGSFPT